MEGVGILFQYLVFAGSSLVIIVGTRMANRSRDRVIIGADGAYPVSIEHRWLILTNDWIPTKFGLSVLAALSGVAISELAEAGPVLGMNLFAALATAFFGFLALFLVGFGAVDLMYCKRVLDQARSIATLAK